MGKRGRRKAREAGDQPQKRGKVRLGQVGPFMVCRECKEPLTLFSLVDRNNEFDEEKIAYIHSLEHIDTWGVIHQTVPGTYDHEAVPVEGDPLAADTVCDFCYSPNPKFAFIPRRTIRVPDPSGFVKQLDYSSPWNTCGACLAAVKAKNMTKMLDRAMTSPSNRHLDQFVRQIVRRQLRDLYNKYIDSNPAGPYEVKIQPKPKPQGTPGSRRGM